MPSLGADMQAGTLVAWRRKVGDSVARGDIIAEVETDKGIIEVEVFDAGVIERLLVEPGTKVPVGTALASISAADIGIDKPSAAPNAPVAQPVAQPIVQSERAAIRPPRSAPDTRVPMSPAARRRARELGVDPERLRELAARGPISVADVEAAAARTAAEQTVAVESGDVQDRLQRLRKAIGAAMSRSKREIPHYYLTHTIDLGKTLEWLEDYNNARPITERVLSAAVLLKATALALREVPELNARWTGEDAPPLAQINLGVAVALRGGGLIAPAIMDTDRLALGELMQRLKDVVSRARTGTLRSSELSEPTFTVTNLGERGVESLLPVIHPPQVCILGIGRIVQRPWVVGGTVVARPVVHISLAADHRVSDGHRGAALLNAIETRLADPTAL